MSYQEGSRNGMLGEISFIPETATSINNPKFSCGAGSLQSWTEPEAKERSKTHISPDPSALVRFRTVPHTAWQ